MATPRKVREFLNIGNSEEGFLALGKIAARHLTASLLASGDVESALAAEVMSSFWQHIEPLMQEQAINFIGEQFTDADLDEIIAYKSSPVAKKANEAIPLFQHQMSTFFEDNDSEMRRIMTDVCRGLTKRP